MPVSPLAIGIVGLVVLVVLVVLAVVSRYKVAGPNEAFIITGRKGKTSQDLSGQKVVTGGGVFVVPFVQQLSKLDLSSRRITVNIRGAVSKQGIKLNVDGIAIVKVGGDEDSIRAAAQRFLSQQGQVEVFTTEVLAGALRSIVGTLTVEEIIRDRASFATQVADVTESALTGQGLVLDTFQIQDVTDDGTYLQDLGRPEAARVQQEATIAEADAKRTAEQRRIAAEQDIVIAQRTLALKQSEIKAETDAASATAAAAGPIAQAARQQEVLTAQELVAQRQAALKDRQLDTEVRKPADAARYQKEQEAEANRATSVAQAKGAAERAKLEGEGELARRTALAQSSVAEAKASSESARLTGEGERSRREAIAQAVKLEGDAAASATLATGTAEAEAMQKKADAFKEYSQAAVIQMLVDALPRVAQELASPMGAIDKLTVISTEGAGALPRMVVNNLAQLQDLVKDMVGVDLAGMISGFAEGALDKGSSRPVPKSSAATPPHTITPPRVTPPKRGEDDG